MAANLPWPDGVLKGTTCRGFNKVGKFHLGNHKTVEHVIETDSPSCGYTTPEAKAAFLAQVEEVTVTIPSPQ